MTTDTLEDQQTKYVLTLTREEMALMWNLLSYVRESKEDCHITIYHKLLEVKPDLWTTPYRTVTFVKQNYDGEDIKRYKHDNFELIIE